MQDLRVGVTASRKSVQLTEALRQRGADVLLGPMLSGDQPAPDEVIAAQTRSVLDCRPNWLVASTGVGMRLWVEAADRVGLGDQVRTLVSETRGVARGAKAVAGFAVLGVRPEWVSPVETDADVAGWLVEHVEPHQRVAIQLHGGESLAYRRVEDAGIEVVTVMPYVSAPPVNDAPARLLITRLVEGGLDVVTFTSPNAVRNLFAIAARMGEATAVEVGRQLSGPTAVASIGPVTTEVLEEHGAVVAVEPERHRTGDLLRAIEAWASRS